MSALEIPTAGLAALHLRVGEYILAAKAPATLAAYRADWRHFAQWCRERELAFLPAAPETVALYLTALAETHKPGTLSRRLTSINKAHQAAGLEAPATMDQAAVRETLKGIRRVKLTAQTGKKPVLTADIQRMIEALPNTLRGSRDRALLLIGFAGAFRRSELAALAIEDAMLTEEGLVIAIRKSKTDQEGKGRQVALPYGSTVEFCPVRAYRSWVEWAGISTGALFRSVDRYGKLAAALHKDSIGMIVKRAATAAGLDAKLYAGHSLRAGFATQAYLNGANEFSIMRQTGHRSLDMVRRYIRDIELFKDNPAAKLGL